jgi:3-amino-4-hydroxybenzoic acid synthase
VKLCWLDIRRVGAAREAIVDEAIHQRIDGIVAADPADLAGLPPTVRRILLLDHGGPPGELAAAADVAILAAGRDDGLELAAAHPTVELGRFVEVVDARSLEAACAAARSEPWSLLSFRDPTKIPLEIVIAAAAGKQGRIITVTADCEEAKVIFGVLEHGADGVMLAPRAVGDATDLKRAAASPVGEIALTELQVVATEHVGMGERACVDTCTYLRQDEGLLVGSRSKGMVLCVSETHPLPYMPTRPFRVNAGAIHSYTVSDEARTRYLSELRAGSKVLAVDVRGRTRVVTVGRVKIETRPLISIDAVGPDGQQVNLILQDDWHVRVLGPGGAVLNSTELAPGDTVLGYLPTAERHVGYPVDEFCLEQ